MRYSFFAACLTLATPALAEEPVESFNSFPELRKGPHVSGLLSVYAPGDGFNSGKLACGGTYSSSSMVHIAYRRWWRVGCGRRVRVCAVATNRCEVAPVMDAGPFGIYTGKLRNAVPDGRWKVHTGKRPPKGWRYRAIADLSVGLWKKLGKPPGLSQIHLTFLPRDGEEEGESVVAFLLTDVASSLLAGVRNQRQPAREL